MHWSARAKWNKAWLEQSAWAARVALAGNHPYVIPAKSTVVITLHSMQQLDDDNASSAIKPVLDGLKGILIKDDSRKDIVLHVRQEQVFRRIDEHVEIEVTGNELDARESSS